MKKRSLLNYYLLLVLFLFPLFFFPWFRDPFVLGKNLFLIVSALLGLALWVFTFWKEKDAKIRISFLDGFFALLAVYLTGHLFFLEVGNRYDALLAQPGVGSLWALTILFFLFGQAFAAEKPKFLVKVLGVSSALVALVGAVLFVLPESRFPLSLGSVLTIGSPLWSPLGSALESVWLLLPVFIFLVASLVRQVNKKGGLSDWFSFGLSVVILVGLVAGVYQLVQLPFPWLDYRTSWSVAAESFKRQPLFGLGPASFSEAFTLYKPASFNLGQWWNTRFFRSSGVYLQWWTELGLIGLGFLVWLVVSQNRKVKSRSMALSLRWGAVLLLPLFLPGGLTYLFLLFFWANLIVSRKEITLPNPEIKKFLSLALAAVGGMIILVVGYLGFKAYRGEYLFFRFVRGVAAGSAQDQDYYQAVQNNHRVVAFRLFRSQIDTSVLTNILTQAAQNQEQLTEEQGQNLNAIAQEAIAEAKAAVALKPQSVVGWENLANTYRQLINLAEGADQWTISAYLQAIALDSANPRLRVELGGVYYGFENYEAASRQFEIAVNLKGDYPNGWYNWAWALKQEDKLPVAVEALQQAVFLVEVDTPDHQQASELLTEWKKELGEAQAAIPTQAPQELIPPQPLPSPQVEEPIELPEEAAPDLEITPSPAEEEAVEEEVVE